MKAYEFEKAQKRVLKRFEITAESRFIEVAAIGGQVHVLIVGVGPPVVIVNGIGCPAAMWAPLMAELKDFSLYAIDPPGCGLTVGAAFTTATVRSWRRARKCPMRLIDSLVCYAFA